MLNFYQCELILCYRFFIFLQLIPCGLECKLFVSSILFVFILAYVFRVVYPNKAKKLDADVHQKLYMSFYIKSAATSVAMKAHQVRRPLLAVYLPVFCL